MKMPRLLCLIQTFVFSATVLLLLPASLAAQNTAARPDRGIMPGASYSVSDIENINLSNGNLGLTIPRIVAANCGRQTKFDAERHIQQQALEHHSN